MDDHKESKATRELKSEIAKEKPRDNEGHFVHVERSENPEPAEGSKNPIDKFFSEHTHYSKSQDDILDVHVGNPLHRITQLLEDIKKQKAFSFTIKGSLGIAGVALALGVFGIFGGGKILCDRGVRTEIGVIKTLNIMETESSEVPVLSQILNYFNPKTPHKRIVLVKNDETVIFILGNHNQTIQQWNNNYVIATGNYDACSQTLSVAETNSIENYFR